MIEVALNRSSHHRFVTTAADIGIAAFAEIRQVRHYKDAHGVGVIKNERVIHFDMDAQQIEPGALRAADVILNRFDVPRGIDPFRVIGLVKRAPQINRLAIKAECSRRARFCDRHRRQTAHSKVPVHDVRRIGTVAQCKLHPIKMWRVRIPQSGRSRADIFYRPRSRESLGVR